MVFDKLINLAQRLPGPADGLLDDEDDFKEVGNPARWRIA